MGPTLGMGYHSGHIANSPYSSGQYLHRSHRGSGSHRAYWVPQWVLGPTVVILAPRDCGYWVAQCI